MLRQLGQRLDGKRASKKVAARRRASVFNVLDFAVRQKQLPTNPLLFRLWEV